VADEATASLSERWRATLIAQQRRVVRNLDATV